MNHASKTRAPISSSYFECLAFPLMALVTILVLNVAPDLISPNVQLAGLCLMVIALGVPHGALDPWIAEKLGLKRQPRHLVIFTLGYLFISALVIAVWQWAPVLSLFIFLIISALHFSGDWAKDLNRPVRLCAGSLLLLLPIGFQTDNVALIFSQLSGAGGDNLACSLALPDWLLMSASAAVTGWALWQRSWSTALELVTLVTLAYFTPPLIYFALYFCLLHSPRHLMGLFLDSDRSQYPRLFRMMLIYTVATCFLAGILWWFWSDLPFDSLALRLIFIGLAALTVPHMLLISTHQYHLRHPKK